MTEEQIQNIKVRYGIIGNSLALSRAIEQATQVARTKLSVLITGENGVGKDVFSKIIHDFSAQKHGPYFSINCGAIPEGTIESELFGHTKGSFTGAVGDHKGYFETADNGTLFLDEVGELPMSTQARLLRVLENGEFVKVGASAVQKTHVRIVAATNRNLPQAILEGRFRQDLYYRLTGVEIHLPPLRERKDDVPLLFRKFAADFSDSNGLARARLTPDAEELLKNYYWAGNIRQLRNVTEHVCLMESGKDVNAEHLRPYLPDNELNRTPAIVGHPHHEATGGMGLSEDERDMLYHLLDAMQKDIAGLHAQINAMQSGHIDTIGATVIHPDSGVQPGAPIRKAEGQDKSIYEEAEELKPDEPISMDEMEKRSIRLALERNHNSRKMAAQELQISERTLYRKIKEYGL